MMKKEEIEQILDKHLKTLTEGKKDEYFEFEAMKLMPEYNACLNAMLELEQTVVKNNEHKHFVSNNEVKLKCDSCYNEIEDEHYCGNCYEVAQINHNW